MKEETPAPPTPSLDCVHLKEHILRLQWISPLNKSCTSNLGYQDYRKRHKQTGCTKNSAEASFFFFFHFSFFIKPIPVRFPVAFTFLLKLPQEDTLSIYRRVEPWQAPRITSLIPTAVEADVLSHRGVTDVTGVFAVSVESGTRILL